MFTDNADPDQTASWGINTVDIVCKNTYANDGLNNIYFFSQLIYMHSNYKQDLITSICRLYDHLLEKLPYLLYLIC